ncbi:MAG: Gfo/Idh/MocA family oxidoreductase [Bacteroidota bacterium]
MNPSSNYSRRTFIKTTAAATAGTMAMSAQSYASILGANDRLNVGVIGLNGRGKALVKSASATDNVFVKYICDVDTRAVEKGVDLAKKSGNKKVKGEGDIRRLLEAKDLDAIMIAAPDHWHAAMTLMGLQAGKHVYVEKPLSHNPAEGELLIQAVEKYGKIVQMGNQQRSGPASMEAVKMIHDGAIGKAYFGKAWYSNTRGSIGKGKQAAVPEWLDYDLWQGPAPRKPFQDNLIHYNWHWFWHWGTGELLNNGTHEIDVCRWALGVDYPIRVSSAGGRYHFDDDWQFYDTQVSSFDFEGGKTITWEGHSCNGIKHYNRGRGALIRGTEGSVMLDRNSCILYDKNGKVVKEIKEAAKSATTNTVGAGYLDSEHMKNFVGAIRNGDAQNSPLTEGHKSVLLCQLGNIAQHLGRDLSINSENGRVRNDPSAMNMWGREYEPGWELKLDGGMSKSKATNTESGGNK